MLVLFVNCSNENDDLKPITYSKLEYILEGDNLEVAVEYKSPENEYISDTTYIPWSRSLSGFTLEPGESFEANLKVKSISKDSANLRAFIKNGNSTRAYENKNGSNISINLINSFLHPEEQDINVSISAGPKTIYSLEGTPQEVVVEHRNLDGTINKDTVALPWQKGFSRDFPPSESFNGYLKVTSLSLEQETITASIRGTKETQSGKDIVIELESNIPSRFQLQ